MTEDRTDPKTFYGTAFTPQRAEHLTKVCKYLDIACRADAGSDRQEMALNAAIKIEAVGLAIH